MGFTQNQEPERKQNFQTESKTKTKTVPGAPGTHAYYPDMEIAEQKGILCLLVLAIKWSLFSLFLIFVLHEI